MKRLPSVAALAGSVALVGAISFLPGSGQSSSTTATTPSPEPTASEAPAKKTLPADAFKVGDLSADELAAPEPAWSPPIGYTGSLKPEDWVTITGTDSCLNVRVSPALAWHDPISGDQPIPTLNCLPDGFVGQLSFGPNTSSKDSQGMPVQADGWWWWYLLGQGWVAQDWLAPAEAPTTTRAELADAGLIAFMREGGVYVMNADGSDVRLLYPVTPEVFISSLRWFPDGQSLAISTSRWSEPETLFTTVIVGVDGTILREFPGLTEGTPSPTGTHQSGIRTQQLGELGGYNGTPVVIDLATDNETPVGPQDWSFRAPEWSPDGLSVAYLCRGSSWEELLPDGRAVRHTFECPHGDGLVAINISDGSARLVFPYEADSYYMNPSWSPDGGTIAVFSNGGACFGYSLFDVASGARIRCLELSQDSFGGRCGGDAELGASDWTPDGRTLAYHWQSGEGLNGVALVDVATGERKMILTTGASSISFSGDGSHLTYESAGYVWTADSDTTDVVRVTDGSLPAWQPAS